MTGMHEWRQQHPKATLREMENELDARWAKVRARMLQDMALQRVATAWKQTPVAAHPTCPPPWKSAVPTHAISKPTVGRPSRSNAAMGFARPARSGFFPDVLPIRRGPTIDTLWPFRIKLIACAMACWRPKK